MRRTDIKVGDRLWESFSYSKDYWRSGQEVEVLDNNVEITTHRYGYGPKIKRVVQVRPIEGTLVKDRNDWQRYSSVRDHTVEAVKLHPLEPIRQRQAEEKAKEEEAEVLRQHRQHTIEAIEKTLGVKVQGSYVPYPGTLPRAYVLTFDDLVKTAEMVDELLAERDS